MMADIEKYPKNEQGSYAADGASSAGEDPEMLAKLGLIEDVSNGTVKRDLKQRHIAMIALGGTIGWYFMLYI